MDNLQHLRYAEARDSLQRLVSTPGLNWTWDWEKQRVHGNSPAGTWALRLPASAPAVPLHAPASKYDGPAQPAVTLAHYTSTLLAFPEPYLLILIQAGHSALGHFEGGEALRHKVIKKYMVRGNGRAQLSYLSTRGKSKAGSRVRLANTVRFFEEINEKLSEWNVLQRASRIFVSCPVKIQPLWFAADPPPPFSRDDARITKVPLDVQVPDLHQLLHVARQLDSGFWEGAPMESVLASPEK